KIKLISNAALLLAALTMGNLSASAQEAFPYTNEFTEAGLLNPTEQWTLDTENNFFHYFQGLAGTKVGTASVQVPGAVGVDFVLSTWIHVNDIQGGGAAITAGFSALNNNAAAPANYYLADWSLGGGGDGNLRILRLGGGSLPTTDPDKPVSGNAGL